MNQSFDSSGVQFAWDSTSITLAETCLRKYQYKMIEGWQHPEKSVHLLFGGYYATALEHYYKHIALGATSDEALELVVEEALIATWNYPCETCQGSGKIDFDHTEQGGTSKCLNCDGPTPAYGPWLSNHNAKTRENLIRTIVWYVDQFENESIEVFKLSDGKPAVEYSFTLPVDDGLMFSGHLDRLVTYAGDQYVMDQKTTGSTISASYFDGFSPDVQMSMYTFAGQIIFNIPVKGVIIDAAQIAVGFTKFERGFTFRSNTQLEEWYETSMYTIRRAIAATKENFFPMDRTACGNYGGCEFRKVCARSPQVRDNFLRADFVKGETWDPLTRR